MRMSLALEAGSCEFECTSTRSVHACLCAERLGSVQALHACRREGGVMKFIVACVRVGRAEPTRRSEAPGPVACRRSALLQLVILEHRRDRMSGGTDMMRGM